MSLFNTKFMAAIDDRFAAITISSYNLFNFSADIVAVSL